MPAQVALFLCCIFIAWLFARDGKRRTGVSSALWIPVLWAAILGSRPVSLWLGSGGIDAGEGYQEGNSLDRLIFLSLIAAGVAVLLSRRANFQAIIQKNLWIFVFFAYCGISVVWSDSPFVAFKRWIKDIGHVVMVLVILSERDPIEAMKAVFARCAYLLIPLSVLVIKYYPVYGSYFNRWTGSSGYQGVTTNKNQLGVTVLVGTLFIVWQLFQMRKKESAPKSKIDICNYVLLLVMALWLFRRADSATSLACAALGSCGIFVLDLPFVKQRREHLVMYGIVGAVILMAVSSIFDLRSMGAGILGRDSSLHGRSEIWSMVLAEGSDPLLGAGFSSFWSPERVLRFREVYSFHLTQAHNGYLETYVNGGVIGVLLLIAMLFSTGKNLQRQLIMDVEFASVRLMFWIVVIIHNWTEASFSKLGLLWFILLLVITEYPRRAKAAVPERPAALRGQVSIPQANTVLGRSSERVSR